MTCTSRNAARVTRSHALAALAAGCVALAGGAAQAGNDAAPVPSQARQQELQRLLRQDCGACHGLRLTGGLGPPLTREALKDRPRDVLVATIEHGRPGTPMPPWRPFISESEARWLAAQLQEGFGDVH